MTSRILASFLAFVLGFSCGTTKPCNEPVAFVDTPLGRAAKLEPGSCVEMPDPLERADPIWPEDLREFSVQGKVILETLIDRDGRIARIRILKTLHPVLDQSAVNAVRKWRFAPFLVNGEAVPLLTKITIAFKLG